jgi:hypothetical protein
VIGAGTSLSVLDVVDVVRSVSGAELTVTHGPARPGEMPAVIVDPARAHGAGWSPQFDFTTGVTGVWDEWKDMEIEGALAFHGADAPPAAAEARRKSGAAAAPQPQPLKRAAARRRG